MTPKVFCVGRHKTGTKSLAAALEHFGYRVTGPDGVRDPDIAKNVHDMARKLADEYDAFQDNPWPVLYREMDERYPGSKFVLTLRSPESWIASMVAHFGSKVTPMRTWIYGVGCPEGNEGVYLDRYDAHNRDVRAHFAGRPGDFLVMDLARGDGWEKLCAFLGKPIPDMPFPHANRAKEPSRGSLLSRLFGR